MVLIQVMNVYVFYDIQHLVVPWDVCSPQQSIGIIHRVSRNSQAKPFFDFEPIAS
jgi:hypothetical protein